MAAFRLALSVLVYISYYAIPLILPVVVVDAYDESRSSSYPDNLCSAGATGYRATVGCTGYVLCNNGQLMGGGGADVGETNIFYCGSGQLFDEGMIACLPESTVYCPTASSSQNQPIALPLIAYEPSAQGPADVVSQSSNNLDFSTSTASGSANQNRPNTNTVSSQSLPKPELCNLCDNLLDLDPSTRTEMNGSEFFCGQFGWFFSTKSVYDGSNQCNNFRGQYSDECCIDSTATQGGGGGVIDNQPPNTPSSQIQIGSNTPSSQTQNIGSKTKCSLCDESQLNKLHQVKLEGYFISCEGFSLIFSTKKIMEGSGQCIDLQSQYRGKCCATMQAGDDESMSTAFSSSTTVPNPSPSLNMAPHSTTLSPTSKPNYEFDKWQGRTVTLLAPAPKIVSVLWPCYFAAVLMFMAS